MKTVCEFLDLKSPELHNPLCIN